MRDEIEDLSPTQRQMLVAALCSLGGSMTMSVGELQASSATPASVNVTRNGDLIRIEVRRSELPFALSGRLHAVAAVSMDNDSRP
jgi:hypothetical protein